MIFLILNYLCFISILLTVLFCVKENKMKIYILAACLFAELIILCVYKHSIKCNENNVDSEHSDTESKEKCHGENNEQPEGFKPFGEISLNVVVYPDESGIKHVLENYKDNFDGSRLYALIFKDKYNVHEINETNLYNVEYIGDEYDRIKERIKPHVNGLHIYVTSTDETIGILLWQKNGFQ